MELLGHAAGRKLTALAWNSDPRQIQTRRRARSAGAQSALGRRLAIERVFKPTLHHLADRRPAPRQIPGGPDDHGPRALSPICARSRARSRCQRRFLQRGLSLRSPRTLVRGVLADHLDERTISLLLAISVSNLEAHAIVHGTAARACRRRTPSWRKERLGAIARRPSRRCDPRALRRTSGGLWVNIAGCAPQSLTSSDALLKESFEYRQRPLQHLRYAHHGSGSC